MEAAARAEMKLMDAAESISLNRKASQQSTVKKKVITVPILALKSNKSFSKAIRTAQRIASGRRVATACNGCKRARTRCDDCRPCKRCVRLGVGNECPAADFPLAPKSDLKIEDDSDTSSSVSPNTKNEVLSSEASTPPSMPSSPSSLYQHSLGSSWPSKGVTERKLQS